MEASTIIPLSAQTTLANPLLQEIPGKCICLIYMSFKIKSSYIFSNTTNPQYLSKQFVRNIQ